MNQTGHRSVQMVRRYIEFLSFLILIAAQEWPQFRGPAGTGIAAEGVRTPIEFAPGKILWQKDVPSVVIEKVH